MVSIALMVETGWGFTVESSDKMSEQLKMALLLSLTLGLAPFVPEPHIVGKIKWVMGGAKGMELLDWGDLLMHGSPWLFLGYTLFRQVIIKR